MRDENIETHITSKGVSVQKSQEWTFGIHGMENLKAGSDLWWSLMNTNKRLKTLTPGEHETRNELSTTLLRKTEKAVKQHEKVIGEWCEEFASHVEAYLLAASEEIEEIIKNDPLDEL